MSQIPECRIPTRFVLVVATGMALREIWLACDSNVAGPDVQTGSEQPLFGNRKFPRTPVRSLVNSGRMNAVF